jgi:hypothetical protein
MSAAFWTLLRRKPALNGAEWRDASSGGHPIVSLPSVQASKMRLSVVSANLEPSVFKLEVYDDNN